MQSGLDGLFVEMETKRSQGPHAPKARQNPLARRRFSKTEGINHPQQATER